MVPEEGLEHSASLRQKASKDLNCGKLPFFGDLLVSATDAKAGKGTLRSVAHGSTPAVPPSSHQSVSAVLAHQPPGHLATIRRDRLGRRDSAAALVEGSTHGCPRTGSRLGRA